MTSYLNESIIVDATLEWFGKLGGAIGNGPLVALHKPKRGEDGMSINHFDTRESSNKKNRK